MLQDEAERRQTVAHRGRGVETPLTQRVLAQRLGVALGLTNLYIKRLASKGFIKVKEFPRKPYAGKRLRYVLTPRGAAEKARLTYEYMGYSLRLFRRTGGNLREAMARLTQQGIKRIALYGVGDAAELAYLTLREFGLEPVGIFAREELDAIIVATFDPRRAVRSGAYPPWCAVIALRAALALAIPPTLRRALRRGRPWGREGRARGVY